jgi:tetratricopeptide (TPR) repeat protein
MFEEAFEVGGIKWQQEKLDNYFVDFHLGSDTLCVTFEPMGVAGQHNPHRLSWGARALVARNLSVLGIKSKGDNWYRRPDLHRFLVSLQSGGFFKGYKKVLFYGGSMGGYAALAFSALADDAVVLALNPQTSLDISIVPWEARFAVGQREDWRGAFADAAVSAQHAREIWVCYDPLLRQDRLHVERLPKANLRKLKIPGVGHKIPMHLHELGLLTTVLDGVLNGTLQPAAFPALARRRRGYMRYWISLGERLKCVAAQRACLERAFALAPEHPEVLGFGIRVAMRANDWPAAMATLGTALLQHPSSSEILRTGSELCEKLGRTVEGVHLTRRLIDLEPSPQHYLRLRRLLLQDNDQLAAQQALEEALERFPDDAAAAHEYAIARRI